MATAAQAAPLTLLCQNGNYLASLTVVREECQQRLPVYHRRVPLPLNNLDVHGSRLSQKSAFFNRDGHVMIKDVDPSSGVPLWTAHAIQTRVADLTATSSSGVATTVTRHRKKAQRCTFGLPRISPFATPLPEGAASRCSLCEKERCACHDSYYEDVIGGRSPSRSPTKQSNSQQRAHSKFLEPLRHVKSHNLFQKILREPSSGNTIRVNTGDTTMGMTSTSQARWSDGEQPPGSFSPSPESTQDSTAAGFRNHFKAPPAAVISNQMARALREDLNSCYRTKVELASFDKRENERREREEFARQRDAKFASSSNLASPSQIVATL